MIKKSQNDLIRIFMVKNQFCDRQKTDDAQFCTVNVLLSQHSNVI